MGCTSSKQEEWTCKTRPRLECVPINMSVFWWSAGVAAFSAYGLAMLVQVAVVMFQTEGQHQASPDPLVVSASLDTTIESMVNSTSISQFAVETFSGYITVMFMTTGASVILCALEPDIWLNLVGYAALALVGLFGTKVPGNPPRRDYNPFFLLWTIDHNVTSQVHIAASAVFLYLPLLRTIWWLHRKRWGRRWMALYLLLFVISVGYGVAHVSVDSTKALNPPTWFTLEIVAFGGSFFVFSLFGLRRKALEDRGYSRL